MKWKRELISGTAMRSALGNGDTKEICSSILDVIKEGVKKTKGYTKESFEELLTYAEETFDNEDIEDDDINYVLNELYDLCDNAMIFIAL